ncbi:MAG: DNA repair protein RadA, partial [Desulfobacterales bacterium]|nr:DNA repair protein RadA [Desulfobacterales bacterium]
FLEGLEKESEGSIATSSFEGTRPLLLEIQALVVPANVGFARRTSIGIDNGRLNMIIAVLEKKAGVSLINHDVYINIVGGIKPEGTSTDLAVALAIYSSYRGIKIAASKVLVFGEIGLTGELRPIPHSEKMIKEALRMGFEKILLPEKNYHKLADAMKSDKIKGIATITKAIEVINIL